MMEAGTVLQNRYRIQEKVGQGGMGTVYIATDERFGSVVAIKETTFDDPDLRRAFEREAHLLNGLRHPALPRVSDHFTESNGQFLVMEYIAGEDLSELLQRVGVFPVADVLTWTGQLLDALEYLHSQRVPVIHRDIKPQNLKLTERGEVILLDFGLAKGNPTDVSRVSLAQSVLGYSRSYASLEQMQGTGTDPRSDLYSLAATAYHLITGKTPIDSLTRATSILNGQPDPLEPANVLRPEIPAAFSQLLAEALSLNSSLRPASAAEMRQALSQIGALPGIESDAVAEHGSITIKSVGTPAGAAVNESAAFAAVNEKGDAAFESEKVAAAKPTGFNEPDTRVQKSDSAAKRAVTNPRRRMSRRGSISTPAVVPVQAGTASQKSVIGKFAAAAIAIIVLGGGLTWYAMSGSNASTGTNANTTRTVGSTAQPRPVAEREDNPRGSSNQAATGGANAAAETVTALPAEQTRGSAASRTTNPAASTTAGGGTAAGSQQGEQPRDREESRAATAAAPNAVAVPDKDAARRSSEQPRRAQQPPPVAREITDDAPTEKENEPENDDSLEADRAEREERLRRREQRREQRQSEREQRRQESRQKQAEVRVEKEPPSDEPFR